MPKHRFTATITIYAWSDEDDLDQAKKEAYQECKKHADFINTLDSECDAEVEELHYIPWGDPSGITKLDIEKLK